MKKALITGITGQDGAYLAALLLTKGYKVIGGYRRVSSQNFWRLRELGLLKSQNLALVELDVTDLSSCISVIKNIAPDEVYNLAAQSFVGTSFQQPATTLDINCKGNLHLLEALRLTNCGAKFYQASTSEMFGKVQQIPQSEQTKFYPRSPYGVAKLYAHWLTVNYREAYGMFACCGILFNHESPLRGEEFVTRKITDGVAKIKLGLCSDISLGNLNAKRDWGFAGDYVDGMWRMLQKQEPDDFILATNQATSVKEFVEMSFCQIGVNIEWEGECENEVGIDKNTGSPIVKVDKRFYRPAEVDLLIGDASKAKEKLGWEPRCTLEQLVSMMVNSDIVRNRNLID